MRSPVPLAVESARALAACMADGTPDKAMVEHVIRRRTEGGRMPSRRTLPPLAVVALDILAGDGTDGAARFWRGKAAGNDYGEECVIELANGRAIRTDTYQANEGGSSYVRVTDTYGNELGYWSCDEWGEDPELVMGAFLGLAHGGPAPAA